MSESILESVKKMIGPDTDYDVYDDDFKSLINSSLATMYQLGAGQDQFVVTGSSETWDDFSQDKLLQAFAQDYLGSRSCWLRSISSPRNAKRTYRTYQNTLFSKFFVKI